MRESDSFELLIDGPFALAESPVYDERADELLWVDISRGTVHALRLADGDRRAWQFGEDIGCIGLAESGRLVVALRREVILFSRETGERTPLAILPHRIAEMRSNDGRVGPDGAFWVSSMDERAAKEEIGALYRVTASGMVEEKMSGLKISNGLAFTADGRTMFHSDTRGPWIERWDFDPASGAIAGRTRICVLDNASGRPDGGACDIEGHYWSCGVSAGVVNRFTREGELLEKWRLPVPRPTMPCFFGAKLDRLVVTTATEGIPADDLAKYPHAGGLFVAAPGTAGVKAFRFRD